MEGLIFCHGHKHQQLKLPPEVKWIYLDADPAVEPDIAGLYQNEEILEMLGREKYDFVYEIRCPFTSIEEIKDYLKIASSLTKEGGEIFLFNGIQRVYSFLHPTITFYNSRRTLETMEEECYQNVIQRLIEMAEPYHLRLEKIDKGSVYFKKVSERAF